MSNSFPIAYSLSECNPHQCDLFLISTVSRSGSPLVLISVDINRVSLL